jgi:hypothetical protein
MKDKKMMKLKIRVFIILGLVCTYKTEARCKIVVCILENLLSVKSFSGNFFQTVKLLKLQCFEHILHSSV